MRPATVWHALMRPPWRFLLGRWPWRTLVYVLSSAAIGFLLLPVTIVTLLLLPLWGIVIGALERRRTRLLGFPRQTSGHVPLSRDQRHIWLAVRVAEGATWRETAALLLDLVLGWIALAVLFVQGLCLVVFVFIGVSGSCGPAQINLFADVRIVVGPDNWWPVIPIALLAVCLFAYVNAVLAAGQASLLRVLCGPRQRELARNVERLVQSRAALVAAFEAERRRIERDLHDGVQQELVTLAARLGMVSLELDDLTAQGIDTALARDALDAAQGQAEHAMATLRNTVRGIHPAVLTDHGLRAALDELADRTPIPLSLDLSELDRLPAPLETAAYYLVTEAISNAAKHTAATRLTVRASIEDDALSVTVTDNGHGGADEKVGTGLRGLRERAETLGGQFSVVSPAGGPTTLHMVLPILTGSVERDASAAR
ncbi:Sensor histidine kinase LiaS [Microbacterium azadirachtae]|uniref:histidine kinase n=1 Tax=Microbacterium azadirachtae TaxID=582680 RepID=A0A0F0L5S4_9MICO|nr:histidine kinase [Microbacterium azadirachtae]KJL26876.1 Sensor histidine kinase LiaS [Microbacterium azadirachtae]